MAELLNVEEHEDHRGRFYSFSLSNKPTLVFYCDIPDLELLKSGKFYVHIAKKKAQKTYIRKNVGNGNIEHFHRTVLGLGKFNPKSVVDHIDRNTFNNRKYNLRETDYYGNRMNSDDINPTKHFGILGLSITWIKTRQFFQAYYFKKYLLSARSESILEAKINHLKETGFFSNNPTA